MNDEDYGQQARRFLRGENRNRQIVPVTDYQTKDDPDLIPVEDEEEERFPALEEMARRAKAAGKTPPQHKMTLKPGHPAYREELAQLRWAEKNVRKEVPELKKLPKK